MNVGILRVCASLNTGKLEYPPTPITAAGAMTIAELCVVGKPAIFVPYPFAAEDHQAVNAMALVQKNAAVMLRDEDVKTNLMTSLLDLASDGEKMEMLESNIAKMGNSNADEIIAKQILKNIKH